LETRVARPNVPIGMQKEVLPGMISRRSLFTLAGACLVSWDSLYAGEFWDKKDPSQWTGEEIDRLTTNSPWARPVKATLAPGENLPDSGRQGGSGAPRGGVPPTGRFPGTSPTIGIPGIGGIGWPRGRGSGGGRGNGGRATNYKGTVLWDSAQPILDATKNPPPEEFAGLYVIATREIPFIEQGRRRRGEDQDDAPDSDSDQQSKEMIRKLKNETFLQPKGKDDVHPSVVRQMTPGGTYFLFGFPKKQLVFEKGDREVEFSSNMGALIVKAKFNLSMMKYHGKLAV
jgi:hypothetical protein